MTEKRVYVVKGSEDGNLGVYSTKRGAYERTRAYLQDGVEKKIKIESYARFCSEFSAHHRFHIVVADDLNTYVDVQEFTLQK